MGCRCMCGCAGCGCRCGCAGVVCVGGDAFKSPAKPQTQREVLRETKEGLPRASWMCQAEEPQAWGSAMCLFGLADVKHTHTTHT